MGDFRKLELEIETGRWEAVVFPSDGIGTGLAKLQDNAPTLLWYIRDRIREMESKYAN